MADKQSLTDLIKTQGGALGLDDTSSDIIIDNLNAGTLPMCMGTPLTEDEAETDDFRVVKFVFDGSSSMDPVKDELITCFNEVVIPGLLGGAADQGGAIRVGGMKFNQRVTPLWLNADAGFHPLRDLPPLTSQDYRPSGTTALNQAALDMVTAGMAYALQLRSKTGSNPEVVLAVLSDGANNCRPDDPDIVYRVLSQLSPELFTTVFIGFETNERVDFRAVAQAMGFRDIIHSKREPGETEEDQRRRFRHVMGVFSQSLVKRASRPSVGPGAAQPGVDGGTRFWNA